MADARVDRKVHQGGKIGRRAAVRSLTADFNFPAWRYFGRRTREQDDPRRHALHEVVSPAGAIG